MYLHKITFESTTFFYKLELSFDVTLIVRQKNYLAKFLSLSPDKKKNF